MEEGWDFGGGKGHGKNEVTSDEVAVEGLAKWGEGICEAESQRDDVGDVHEDVEGGPEVADGVELDVMEKSDGVCRQDEGHGAISGGGDPVAEEQALGKGDAHGGQGLDDGEDGEGDVAQRAGIGEDEGGEKGAGDEELAQQGEVEEGLRGGGSRVVGQEQEGDDDALDAEKRPGKVETGLGENGLIGEREQDRAQGVGEAGEYGFRWRAGEEWDAHW